MARSLGASVCLLPGEYIFVRTVASSFHVHGACPKSDAWILFTFSPSTLIHSSVGKLIL